MKTSTRRAFLETSLGCSVIALTGCSRDEEPSPVSDDPEEVGEQGMRLSLSVRVAESFFNKEESSMTIEELIGLAKTYGYSALCMRASQAGVHTPAEVVSELSRKIRESGLTVSMITGDFAVPRNDEKGPGLLRNITPYLDLADAFGSDLIRVCMKEEEDIARAQKSADEARERNIRLAHQSHCSSLFETVDNAVRTLEAVDRRNFGIIYEAANWMLVEEDYGPATIERLRPHIFNVYVQNHVLASEGETTLLTWKKGPVKFDHIGIWEQGGVDFQSVFAALRKIGYRGYVTVHQSFQGIMSVEESVKKSAEFLRGLITA